MAVIVISRAGRADVRIPLPPKEAVVGRLPTCTITIDDQEVSRQHAALTPGDEGYTLRDLESRNGTWVNGQRVGAAQVLLRDGDRIQLGKSGSTLRYFADDVSATREVRGRPTVRRQGGEAVSPVQTLLRMAPIVTVIASVLGVLATLLLILDRLRALLVGD